MNLAKSATQAARENQIQLRIIRDTAIRLDVQYGLTYDAAALEYNLSASRIWQICNKPVTYNRATDPRADLERITENLREMI